VLRQPIYHAFTPIGRRQLSADVLANLPVETHELRIDRLVRTLASLLDEADHLGERGFDGLGCGQGGKLADRTPGFKGGLLGAHVRQVWSTTLYCIVAKAEAGVEEGLAIIVIGMRRMA